MSRYHTLTLLTIWALTLSGWTYRVAAEEEVATETTSDAVVPKETAQSDEAVLRERAEARWGKLIQGDFDAAYAFESPAYQATFTASQFRGRFGGDVTWQAAHAIEVKIADDGATAVVRLNISYQAMLPQIGKLVKGMRPVEENWLRDGQIWWHLSSM